MLLQKIRHAGEDVGPSAPKVDLVIAIAVARVGTHAARHELWCSHRSRVGAGDLQRVHAMFASEQQKFFQFCTEVRCAGWVVEGECGQRIQHAVLAGDGAVESFHADDADDGLRRHTPCRCNTFERLAVGLPKGHAFANAPFRNEARAILEPRLGLFRRPVHRFDDGGLRGGRQQHGVYPRGVEAMLADHLGAEAAHVFTGVVHRQRCRCHPARYERAEKHRDEAGCREGATVQRTSFRWEWMDRRIPNPARRVTALVPP